MEETFTLQVAGGGAGGGPAPSGGPGGPLLEEEMATGAIGPTLLLHRLIALMVR